MLPETLKAPVSAGEKVVVLRYELNGKVLGEVGILTNGSVEKAGFFDYLQMVMRIWNLGAHT